MVWKESDRMSLRREFVILASSEGASMSALCRQFGVSRKTGYKWLSRFREHGETGLADRSRRPKKFRTPTAGKVEQRVLAIRDEHPTWGGRKIRKRLQVLGEKRLPAASTVTEILRRHGRILDTESRKRESYGSFERDEPNALWQIDFKGEFKMTSGRYCHPLTVLDDHSRYAVGLIACSNERRNTVQNHLIELFRRYGLPQALYSDNGRPWGSLNSPTRHTRLTAWLMRLDVQVIHGRPYYPQGRGKQERFHRTLKAELLQDRFFDNLQHTQERFDPWRQMYNQERPHEALNLNVPASRYHTSSREYPEQLDPFEYAEHFETRKTNRVGQFSFQRRVFKTGEAFGSQRLGLSPAGDGDVWDVYYCHFRIGQLDMRSEDYRVRRASAVGPAASARCARSSSRPNRDPK